MILGQRIRLRPIEKDDLPRFVKWLADPELRSYIDRHAPIGQVQEERWFDRNLNSGDMQEWAVDAQPADMAVGPWVHIGSRGVRGTGWGGRGRGGGLLLPGGGV